MQRLSDILAVVDPRDEDRPAFRRALEIASRTGARLHLLMPDYLEGLSRGVFADERKLEQARHDYISHHEKELDGLTRDASDAGVEADGKVVWQRPHDEAIIEAAYDWNAGLIVKSAGDRSLPERLLFGATDWDLIRKAPQPVWLVKRSDSVADSDWIVAVDPSHPDERHVGLDGKLLETGKFLGDALGAALQVFHAVSPPALVAPTGGTGAAAPTMGTVPEEIDVLLEDRKNRTLELLDRFDIPERNAHVSVGAVARQLEELVERRDASVVIAGAVSRSTLERFLIGNTAESFLNRVACDVLVVKPEPSS